MTWQLVLEIVATAIASVGGAGAIIWALSSFFGKMWANKLLEKQKAEYQKDIEQYKSALSRELENVKATNEKITYISKVKYDIEISAIKDLTSKSHNVLIMCYSIIPFDKPTLSNVNEIKIRNQKHYTTFMNNLNLFMSSYGASLAFITEEISELYNNFLVLCREQFDLYTQIYNPQFGIPPKYIDLLYDKDESIEKAFFSAINAIKTYLNKIKVAD